MRRQLFPSIVSMVIFTVILGIGFPLVILGIGQLAFHDKANGSIIERNGKAVGSELIGQAFTDKKGDALPEYFQSRPSAAAGASGSTEAGYDPTLSSGSNLGPTNPDFLKLVEQRVKAYRKLNRLSTGHRGAGRRGHRVGLGPRPEHLDRQRAIAGAAGRRTSAACP